MQSHAVRCGAAARVDDKCGRCCSVCVFEAWGLLVVVYAVQEDAVSRGSLQVVDIPMLWTCTIVHRAHGRLRSLVWRVLTLLRHLLGTWPSSRGVGYIRSIQLPYLSMLWTCTTVHRAHGRLLSSVWRVFILRRHLLGTWPSLLGVGQVIAAFALCDGGFVSELLCADDACMRRVIGAALWCMRCRRLPSHEGRHCR